MSFPNPVVTTLTFSVGIVIVVMSKRPACGVMVVVVIRRIAAASKERHSSYHGKLVGQACNLKKDRHLYTDSQHLFNANILCPTLSAIKQGTAPPFEANGDH